MFQNKLCPVPRLLFCLTMESTTVSGVHHWVPGVGCGTSVPSAEETKMKAGRAQVLFQSHLSPSH